MRPQIQSSFETMTLKDVQFAFICLWHPPYWHMFQVKCCESTLPHISSPTLYSGTASYLHSLNSSPNTFFLPFPLDGFSCKVFILLQVFMTILLDSYKGIQFIHSHKYNSFDRVKSHSKHTKPRLKPTNYYSGKICYKNS